MHLVTAKSDQSCDSMKQKSRKDSSLAPANAVSPFTAHIHTCISSQDLLQASCLAVPTSSFHTHIHYI